MQQFFLRILMFVFIFSKAFSQQSKVDTHAEVLYLKAVKLFNEQQYLASQQIFKTVEATNFVSKKADTDYYIAQTAIFLNQDNAEQLIENFIENYPSHPKGNTLNFEVGNYYYNIGKYANARKWYERVDVSDLNASEKEKYYFNLGYALYTSKRYAKAESNLKKVVKSKIYGSQANYYLGYISYKADDYNQADEYFEEIKETSKLSKKLSYYKADKYFKKGAFEEAISEAKQELVGAKPSEKSELNKIVGESYFNLKEYQKAIDYLEQYKGKGGKWSNTDHYLLGYAYYKKGNYKKAISRFNKIIGGKDAVAQNAYYHLADSYLKLGQKPEALNAFKNAYEMTYSKEIKKDAGYNYSKLSYEIGNSYESVPSVLRTYLVKYPDSNYREELSSLLINSYVSTKNYKEALEVLTIDNKPQNNEILQKVSYLYGLELHKNSKFDSSITQFDKAITLSSSQSIKELATFWKAESLYKLGEYSKAAEVYAKINNTNVNETLQLKDYQLGYCFFKLKQHDQAIVYYNKFLNSNPSTNYQLDAVLRLADSYFVSAQYWTAIESYNKAIALKHPKADYAHFQKAICYGFLQKNDQKINDLEKFLINFKQSNYKDDAVFALANVYVAEGNTQKGIQNYQLLQKELPNSTLVSKAILKEGLIYYNQNKSEKAIERFKLVAEKYPKTAEALQAVKTARLVYIDTGNTQAYADWVNTLNFVEITNEELDNTTYLAGEKQFLDNNVPKAIANFEDYLKQFPSGLHSLEAHFYLGQLYSKTGNSEKALPNFLSVAKLEKSEFTETALYNITKIYLENKLYDKAIPYLQRLEAEADFEQNIIFAKTNLMKSYNEEKQYDKTLIYANDVLSNKSIKQAIKTDAEVYKARAAKALNQLDVAEASYQKVATTATNALGAEAVYHLALFNTNKKQFKQSNTYVQKLAKEFSSYRQYSAKGLILMAQNFKGLGDAYQATYVLGSVVSNFKDFPEEVETAQKLLKEIKAEEAKVNSSINE